MPQRKTKREIPQNARENTKLGGARPRDCIPPIPEERLTHFHVADNSDAFRDWLTRKGIAWIPNGHFTAIPIGLDIFSLGKEFEMYRIQHQGECAPRFDPHARGDDTLQPSGAYAAVYCPDRGEDSSKVEVKPTTLQTVEVLGELSLEMEKKTAWMEEITASVCGYSDVPKVYNDNETGSDAKAMISINDKLLIIRNSLRRSSDRMNTLLSTMANNVSSH